MTYDECMRRLMACPALPRGERLATYLDAVIAARKLNRKYTWTPGRNPFWLIAVREMDHERWDEPRHVRKSAAPLRRAREERQKWKRRAMELAPLMGEVHRLQCQGAFSLERDPFNLIPAIDAYAADEISGGKMREYIRRWLAGESFRVSGTLDHEAAFARLKDGE